MCVHCSYSLTLSAKYYKGRKRKKPELFDSDYLQMLELLWKHLNRAFC